jgi:hypothetical protein
MIVPNDNSIKANNLETALTRKQFRVFILQATLSSCFTVSHVAYQSCPLFLSVCDQILSNPYHLELEIYISLEYDQLIHCNN